MSASSPAPKTRTVISFLGTVLDNARGAGRWQKWRPNIALHQQTAQRFDRLELFYSEKFRELAELVRADLAQAAPHLAVSLVPLELANPWDFGEVYTKLHDWAAAYPFDTESEEYFTHITTGTHVAQGRIGSELVAAEIERLQWQWQDGLPDSVFRQPENPSDAAFRLPTDNKGQPEIPAERIRRILEAKGRSWDDIDRFDQFQLAAVAAECRRHKNLAAAGRALYQASRLKRSTPNDSDRLRKYLQRFGLEWADVAE